MDEQIRYVTELEVELWKPGLKELLEKYYTFIVVKFDKDGNFLEKKLLK